MIARGLPEEAVNLANEKMAAINAAYDAIGKERGLRRARFRENLGENCCREGRPVRLVDWASAWAVVWIWAFNFIAAKVGVGQFPPLLFLALRFALVALLLAPFLRPLAGRWRRMLVLSVVLGGCHFGLLFVGLSGVGAGPAAIAIQLGVPFSALLAWIIYRERLGAWQLAGMAVAFAGIWLLAGAPAVAPSLAPFLMVVAAALAWSGANILIKELGAISPFVLNAWFGLLAAPQLLVLSLIVEEGQTQALATADWRGWAALAYTVIGASIVAYGLWYHLIARHEVNRVVPMTLLAPVFAIGLAHLILGEPLTMPVLTGGAVTLAGVAMIQFLRPRDSRIVRRPAP